MYLIKGKFIIKKCDIALKFGKIAARMVQSFCHRVENNYFIYIFSRKQLYKPAEETQT